MIKRLLICILFTHLAMTSATAQDTKSYIEDPMVSLKCKSLLEEKNMKVAYKQKLETLLTRTLQIEKRNKQGRETGLKQIQITKEEIKNNLRLTSMRISTMDEEIVRKGCPGVRL